MSEVNSKQTKAPLKIGVLLCGNVQFMDVAAVDLLAMATPSYLRWVTTSESVIAQGREMSFHYITDSIKESSEMPTAAYSPITAEAHLRLTDTLDSVGALDYLFIPGPSPTYEPSAESKAFIRAHVGSRRPLLVVCTGILPVAYSGVLAGRRATAPLFLLPPLRSKVPDVTWMEKRWEVDADGLIWTSGAITNGMDMVAAFMRKTFPLEVANLVCMTADVGDRGQDYAAIP